MTDIVERLRRTIVYLGNADVRRPDRNAFKHELALMAEAATEIETMQELIRGLLTVVDKQDSYVAFHLLRTGERMDEAEVAPLRAIIDQARQV